MRQIRTNLHNDKCVAGQMPTQTNMYNDTKTQILVYLDIWLLTSVASSISVFFIQLVKEYCIVVQTLKCNFVLYSFSCSLKTVYANSICPRDTARQNKKFKVKNVIDSKGCPKIIEYFIWSRSTQYWCFKNMFPCRFFKSRKL